MHTQRQRYSYEQIIQLIADAGNDETTELEFKSSACLDSQHPHNSSNGFTPDKVRERLRNQVSKSCSALANTNGGLLIFGIQDKRKGPKKGPRKIQIDSPAPLLIGNTAVDQVVEEHLKNSIKPPLKEPQVYTVESDDGSARLLIIEVERALRPHQANDGRYYGRLGKSCDILHDDQIEDIRARRLGAKLEIAFDEAKSCISSFRSDVLRVRLCFSVTNVGGRIASKYAVKFQSDLMANTMFDCGSTLTPQTLESNHHSASAMVRARFGLFPKEQVEICVLTEIRVFYSRHYTLAGLQFKGPESTHQYFESISLIPFQITIFSQNADPVQYHGSLDSETWSQKGREYVIP